MRTIGWGLSIALLMVGSAGAPAPAPGSGIFMADTGNNRIVRIDDMTGVGWTALGSWGSGTNQFDSPRGIFVDARGRIFVTDSNNHRIVRIDDMTGAGWTTFGSFGEGPNQLLGPVGGLHRRHGENFCDRSR